MNNTINFKHSSNVIILKKGDPYRGYSGIIRSYVPSKYDVLINDGNIQRKLLINKSWVKKYSDDVVKVIKGDYKNLKGRISNRYDAEVMVNVIAIGKDYKYKKKDVFYTDFLLTNNSYLQVDRISYINNIIRIDGYEMSKDTIVQTTIDSSLIKSVIPGFQLYITREINVTIPPILKSYVSEGTYEEPEEENHIEEKVYEEESENDDIGLDDDEDDKDEEQGNYADLVLEDDETEEKELKVSYKDEERSEYMTERLTEHQREYEMYIIRLGGYIEIVDKYDIFQKAEAIMKDIVKPGYIINACLQKKKKEVAMQTYNQLRSMNLKFIIACLVFYDLNKSRNISYDAFFNSIPETFFNETMDTIVKNIFLLNNVPRFMDITEEGIRMLKRTNNRGELIKYSLRRCDVNLRMVLNIGIYEAGNIELQSVKRVKNVDMDIDRTISNEQQNKNRMKELRVMIERGIDNDGKYSKELFDLEVIEYSTQDEKTLVEKIGGFEKTLKKWGDPTGKLKRTIDMIRKAIYIIKSKKVIMKDINNSTGKKKDILKFVHDNIERAETVLSSMNDDDERKRALSKCYKQFLEQYNALVKKKDESDVLISEMSKMKIL